MDSGSALNALWLANFGFLVGGNSLLLLVEVAMASF